MDYVVLGKRVREARKTMDITQMELAEKLGISASFLGHIERGSRVPSLETIAKICKLTGVSSDYLMGISDYAYVSRIPDSVSEDKKKIVLQIIEKMMEIIRE